MPPPLKLPSEFDSDLGKAASWMAVQSIQRLDMLAAAVEKELDPRKLGPAEFSRLTRTASVLRMNVIKSCSEAVGDVMGALKEKKKAVEAG